MIKKDFKSSFGFNSKYNTALERLTGIKHSSLVVSVSDGEKKFYNIVSWQHGHPGDLWLQYWTT
jgi:hypothetical protein